MAVRYTKNISYLLFSWLLLYTPSNLTFATSPKGNRTGNDKVNAASATSTTSDYILQTTSAQIGDYYERRHDNKRDGFNGCVLVAKDGVPIYQGAFGYGNFTSKDTLTTQSSFQLASTSKTFTSAAILHLVEEGKLSLDDDLEKFFPGFPFKGVTVKMLLTHRSALPEYIHWSVKYVGKSKNPVSFNNQSLLEVMMRMKPPKRFHPDKVFKYTNTNFALLGCIIEKVSGQSYKQYMQENIFGPLGMANTFVFSMDDSSSHRGASCYLNRWQEWTLNFSDGVVGDKGVYSSVEDLLKWDNALKQGKIISLPMQREAYSPHSLDRLSFRDKSRNYGYGWHIQVLKDRTYTVYHNGNWHGCNNVFSRDLTDGYTIIVLSNKANNRNYHYAPVLNILEQMKNAQNMAAVQQP